MAAKYAQSDQFRGARIHLCDLAGLEIRDCEVTWAIRRFWKKRFRPVVRSILSYPGIRPTEVIVYMSPSSSVRV